LSKLNIFKNKITFPQDKLNTKLGVQGLCLSLNGLRDMLNQNSLVLSFGNFSLNPSVINTNKLVSFRVSVASATRNQTKVFEMQSCARMSGTTLLLSMWAKSKYYERYLVLNLKNNTLFEPVHPCILQRLAVVGISLLITST